VPSLASFLPVGSGRAEGKPGIPAVIVVDYGPEFTSKAMDRWARLNGVRLHFIDPGKPAQNAFVESFSGKLRDTSLSPYWSWISTPPAATRAYR